MDLQEPLVHYFKINSHGISTMASRWLNYPVSFSDFHYLLPSTAWLSMSDPNNDRVEAQSGGGKRVDSPPALTPTRLRTSIKATERDIGVISKAQLRRTQHTNRSTSIMETADPPDNPLLDSPNIRCASELFPRTEANVSFDGFRTPPGDSPLSSG